MVDFYRALFDHLPLFLGMVVGSMGLLYLLFRRHIFSVFDPLFALIIINEGFCIADVLFLHNQGLISTYYLQSYLLTEGALFLGILQFRPTVQRRETCEPYEVPRSLLALYRMALPLYLLLNGIVYATRGIPLLMDSRTTVFQVGGGFGLIRRASDVLMVVILYALFAILPRRKWALKEWAALLAVALIQVLSGAKVAVLYLVFTASLFNYYIGPSGAPAAAMLNRLLRRLTSLGLVALLVIAQATSNMDEIAGRQTNLFGLVAARLVMCGDALIYTYPEGKIETFPRANPVGALTREYLSFFRLARPEDLPRHLGSQITTQLLNPDSPYQTNEKHNLVGYLYFGFWGGVLFCYLLGTVIGYLRFGLIRRFPAVWTIGIPFVILNLNAAMVVNEPDAINQAVIGVVVFYLPLALLATSFARRFVRAGAVPGDLSAESPGA